MNAKDRNDLKFGVVIFAPMLIIPIIWIILVGELNVSVTFLAPVIGILCGHLALIFGIVQDD